MTVTGQEITANTTLKAIILNNAKQIYPLKKRSECPKLLDWHGSFKRSFPFPFCRDSPGKCRELLPSLVSPTGSISKKMERKIGDTRRSIVYSYVGCRPASVRPWPCCSWSSKTMERTEIESKWAKNIIQKLLRRRFKRQSWKPYLAVVSSIKGVADKCTGGGTQKLLH